MSIGCTLVSDPKIKQVGIVNVQFGNNVTVVQPSNIYGCTVGDDVFIGPFVEIQKDVMIGKGTRIQSHTFVCELVTIGQDCTIAHGVMFINDLFTHGGPARNDKQLWKSTQIGSRVSIGSNATILPVAVCDDVIIGAGAVVTRNITVAGTYVGNPARLMKTQSH